MRLNLGCGRDVRSGWWNVDIDPDVDADEFVDLEKTPWPWRDDSAEHVLASNVLEHIPPERRTVFIEEALRVLEPDGVLETRLPVPEAGTAGWDVTHYAVPSWRWPLHDDWNDRVKTVDFSISRVGPGRVVPEQLALLLTRFNIARCVDEVTVKVTHA